MGFSINTNSGAMIALQNLSSTNGQMSTVQSRINTGLRVSSTKDDSANFAIAQNLRADIGGLNAVKSSLDRGKSTLDVAISAAESISEVLIQMKEKAEAAADTGMDEDSRVALQNDFNKLSKQLVSFVKGAEFNGSNILIDTGQSLSALISDSGDTIQVANQGLNGAGGELEAFMSAGATPAAVAQNWSGATGHTPAGTAAGAVDTAIEAMNTVLSELGSASRQIDTQLKFTSKLSDTIETGIGNLVDADLAKESAKLQALQTKQQLGLQALSIANQAPQSILSLFR